MLGRLCKAHSIGISYKISEKAWIYKFEFTACSQIELLRQPLASYGTTTQYSDRVREW
jgi:hypothetical protein